VNLTIAVSLVESTDSIQGIRLVPRPAMFHVLVVSGGIDMTFEYGFLWHHDAEE
jgi:hypothetical protein